MIMTKQDEQNIRVDTVTGAEEYAELLQETKDNADFYKLVSVAMASYTDGIKAAIRCQNTAQAAL